MRDLANNIVQGLAFNPATINTDTTTAGNVIDRSADLGESLTILFGVGVVTAGDVTLLVQESDDNVTYTNVADDDLIGTEAGTKLDASNTTSRIGYVGAKQYVKVSVVSDNSANIAAVNAYYVKGHLLQNPNAPA